MNETIETGHSRRRGDRHLDEDLCLDLLSDLIPSEERNELIAHMAACSACESLFQERVSDRESLRARGSLRLRPDGVLDFEVHEEAGLEEGLESAGPCPAEVAGDTAGWTPQGVSAPPPPERRPWWRALGVTKRPRLALAAGLSAAAIGVLASGWFSANRSGAGEGLVCLPPYEVGLHLRATDDGFDSPDLVNGLRAYGQRNWKGAVGLLTRARASGPAETVRRIYLANALTWSKHPGEAARLIEGIPAEDLRFLPDPWGEEALWTYFIALRDSGRRAGADSLLARLAEESGVVGDRARKILARR